jgi:hypothetical protein
MKLRIFRISFKLYYRELCDWGCEYVKARNRQMALQKFGKKHGVESTSVDDPENWRWWEDDWYYAFQLVEEVAGVPEQCGLARVPASQALSKHPDRNNYGR